MGAEPVPLRLPAAQPPGGVALAREWTADLTTASCAPENLAAIAFDPENPAETFGTLLAANRLDLPVACATPKAATLAAPLMALGLLTPTGHLSETVEAVFGGARVRMVADNFSLANAVRAVGVAGGGGELFVHLAALARESGVVGFSRMVRVLAPETPAVPPLWLREHGVAASLACLGDALHDVPTATGRLKDALPTAPPPPGEHSRTVFVRGRASGAEAVARVEAGVEEMAGTCRVFDSEGEAVRAVEAGGVEEGALVVARGCGARGGPGLSRLDVLAKVLRGAGLSVSVLTDGVAPEGAPGVWASMFAPEAAAGGVVGLLRDGDALRLDFTEGRIRTAVETKDLNGREPFVARSPAKGYGARYAASALPALEGAGFG